MLGIIRHFLGHPRSRPAGLLRRLATGRGGTTLAMMAVFMIPLSAMVGSAVDTARLYVVKVRLQQACDAGVLAGRRFLEDSADTKLDANAAQQARTFFVNNFQSGWLGTTAPVFTPAKTADNQVSGTANVQVPMTVMKMFGMNNVTVNVACEARLDVADADIMFVLDTTGSMACPAASTDAECKTYTDGKSATKNAAGHWGVPEATGSRIQALREAVVDFFDTVDANTDPSTLIRYGIVPYTVTVNVGRELPLAALLGGNVQYQSRRLLGDYPIGDPWSDSVSDITQDQCNAYAQRTPASGYDTSARAIVDTVSWSRTSGSGTTAKGKCTIKHQRMQPAFRYEPVSWNVDAFKRGDAVVTPTEVTGVTSRWKGCVDTIDTTATDTFVQGKLPADLDPDQAGTWRPHWPDVVYYRYRYNTLDYTSLDSMSSDSFASKGNGSCGKAVQRLTRTTRTAISNYVNGSDFRAVGGTYHDVGMLWGAKLLSQDGPFRLDTAPRPGRTSVNRHIVFMTDGQMAPTLDNYSMYGSEFHDGRVTGGTTAEQVARHNARFLAACAAARRKNITVWVISLGQTMTDELNRCATEPSDQHAFFARDEAELRKTFKDIAKQVAMLRISK